MTHAHDRLLELASRAQAPFERVAHAQDTPKSNVFDKDKMGEIHAIFFGPNRRANAEFYVVAKDGVEALILENRRLRDALHNFLDNPLFQVGVGGNPYAVEKMIAEARAALTPEAKP